MLRLTSWAVLSSLNESQSLVSEASSEKTSETESSSWGTKLVLESIDRRLQ